MTKIKDVAERAGVSVATVSRVLSGSDKVRPETKRHVLQVVEAMEYRPNLLGRQLRTQSTGTVVVVVPGLENTAFLEVVDGIEEAADGSGHQILIADMRGRESIEEYYLNAIRQRQIDGIISMSAQMAQKLLLQVAAKYPLVMALQSFGSERVPVVSIDNRAGARTAVEHLLQLGHRRVAHVTTAHAPMVYRERMAGYREAMTAWGIPVEETLIRYGEPTIRSGMEQAEALLQSGKEFTAVFAAGDTMAIGVLKALKKAGRQVPEDCSVVGFDDIRLSEEWEPALTTIHQPLREIGQQAFSRLMTILRGETPMPVREILPHTLVLRESTAALSGR